MQHESVSFEPSDPDMVCIHHVIDPFPLPVDLVIYRIPVGTEGGCDSPDYAVCGPPSLWVHVQRLIHIQILTK